jgi:hypothetical protein
MGFIAGMLGYFRATGNTLRGRGEMAQAEED